MDTLGRATRPICWDAEPKRNALGSGGIMGITFLRVKVINPQRPKNSQICEFLVDSGAVYSVVPQKILKKLGIKATSSQEFILANGEVVKRAVGNAYFEYRDNIRAAPVVFGDEGVFLLGATTIEALGMILDPIRRELKPLPMLLM
jgi:predicted aspartyl protease